MNLVQCFDKHGCDKGTKRHRYDRVYEPHLEPMKDQEINILEVGVFKGSSTAAWCDFLPKATIYGIDIFVRVAPEKIPALNHPRVKWCKCDSIEGPNDEFGSMVGDITFDVIIDDGLHTHDAQRKTFENFFPYLKEGGSYFIEDVWPWSMMSPKQRQHHWMRDHPNDFSEQQFDQLLNVINQHEVICHDLRKGFHNDTFIIEVRK